MRFPQLRPYQKELCEFAREEHKDKNVYVYAPTGTGKTEVALEYRMKNMIKNFCVMYFYFHIL